ncbi:hypothetical protein CAEBREN_06462 [Caenorhabditis brenneri]|uniref:Uncharacterized protein n=1 Tax=Caenorhabditis brenneri TaxID=135651 RepID=G0N5X1_CAEBE|nr:hypothetical protein CAEBREN_06462 [Caenorhabditis brenneri]
MNTPLKNLNFAELSMKSSLDPVDLKHNLTVTTGSLLRLHCSVSINNCYFHYDYRTSINLINSFEVNGYVLLHKYSIEQNEPTTTGDLDEDDVDEASDFSATGDSNEDDVDEASDFSTTGDSDEDDVDEASDFSTTGDSDEDDVKEDSDVFHEFE